MAEVPFDGVRKEVEKNEMSLDNILSQANNRFYLTLFLFERGVHFEIFANHNLYNNGITLRAKPEGLHQKWKTLKIVRLEEAYQFIQNYGKEKIEEIQPMNITLTSQEVMKAFELYLSEHLIKSPITVKSVEVVNKINNTWSLAFDLESKGENHE